MARPTARSAQRYSRRFRREREFAAIVIAGGPEGEQSPLAHTAFPCGVCRQVLAEFCPMDFPVIVARSPEDYEVYTLRDLLPQAFTPLSL